MLSTKSQARNPKQIQMFKSFKIFKFRDCFEFRISDFGFILLLAVVTSMVAVSSSVSADSLQIKSQNYKVRDINFGHPLSLVSKEESVAPVIAGDSPEVSAVTSSTATIKWSTDKKSNSIIKYSKDQNNLDLEAGKSTELVKAHSVSLVGLDPGTTYYYQLTSKDAGGNVGKSSVLKLTTTKTASISQFEITDITLTTAVVAFKTPGNTKSTLNYGTTTDYGKSLDEAGFTTTHTFRITGLTQGTSYHLLATVEAESGEKKQSDDYVFSTNPIPAIDKVSFKDVTSSGVTLLVEANTEVSVQVAFSTKEPVEILGIKPGEKRTAGSTAQAKSHEIKLVGLVGDATYTYQLVIDDSFGNRTTGGETTFRTPRDSVPPVLTPLKIEPLDDSKDASGDVKLVITYGSDKPATTQIAYAQGVFKEEKAAKTPENTNLTTSHLLILNVKPASTYGLVGISRDHAGNVSKTDTVTVATPKARRSALQFALDQFVGLFGAFFKAISP